MLMNLNGERPRSVLASYLAYERNEAQWLDLLGQAYTFMRCSRCCGQFGDLTRQIRSNQTPALAEVHSSGSPAFPSPSPVLSYTILTFQISFLIGNEFSMRQEGIILINDSSEI